MISNLQKHHHQEHNDTLAAEDPKQRSLGDLQ
jgi:hypothetical protein